jgi:hypothetical protein
MPVPQTCELCGRVAEVSPCPEGADAVERLGPERAALVAAALKTARGLQAAANKSSRRPAIGAGPYALREDA